MLIRGLFLILPFSLASCDKYCFELINSDTASVNEVRNFVESGRICKKPSVLSLLIRSRNRDAVDYLLASGYSIENKSYPQLIRNAWWDLIPNDIDWTYPSGNMENPYAGLCGIESNAIFNHYIIHVEDAGIRLDAGLTCLHSRINKVDDPSDQDLNIWRENLELILDKGGSFFAETEGRITPLHVFEQRCQSRELTSLRCAEAHQIVQEVADHRGIELPKEFSNLINNEPRE